MLKIGQMRKILLHTLFLALSSVAFAQQWPGYVLYSVSNSNSAYLLDTSGNVYHTWTMTNAGTGYSTYMEPGGTIVRTVKVTNGSYNGGGLTGRCQKVDYAGTVTWDWTHSASTYLLHHDHHVLPNGNVLFIAYENKTAAEVSAAGCSQSLIVQSEKIIEVQPTGATTGNIVWEWHLWDHLVQNVDANKANYQTSISAHPELLNVNYSIQKDWIHMNGIDYNEALDQIVVSSHNLSEIYIIDHSTTTAEAASHAGGLAGKGGDFLYRWGNPQVYSAGTAANKILKVVHDAHWIPAGSPNAGRIVGFNNDGISTQQSCIDYVDPPLNGYNYDLNPGPAYLPSSYTTRVAANGHASNMSNSEQYPNGNTQICMATLGTIYEIDASGTVIWTQQINGGFVPQAHRYSECYINGGTEPTALVSASTDSICAGDAVTLNLTPGGGTNYTYNWASSPAGFSSTAQNPVVNPTVSTTYTVTVTSGGCITATTVGITVVAPTTPSITQNGDTLFASAGASYQWYLNGNIIAGATNNTYIPTQSGNYTVVITNAAGCESAASSPITVTIVAINRGLGAGWMVYPNPTKGALRIVAPAASEFVVTIADACGKRVLVGANAQVLDLSTLQPGLYFVSIYVGTLHVGTTKVMLTR
jgi:hypothetical protein